MKKTIGEIIHNRRVVAGGVFGSNVDKYSLKERDFKGQRFANINGLDKYYEILSITKPDIISEVYERILKAGSDIILTNTIFANRANLKEKGLEDIAYELNLAAAKIARDKVTKYTSITREKPRYVAGCLSDLETEDFDTAQSYYSEQIKALYAGKIDFLVLKNMQSKLSIRAALSAIDTLMKRRNKFAEIVLSINNLPLFKEMCEENFIEEFSNIKLVATGFRLTVEEDFENIFDELNANFSGRKMISLYREKDSNITDVELLDFAEKISADEDIRMVMLLENFSPEFFLKLSQIFK